MKKVEPYWPLILLLALVKFILPLFLQSPIYELQRDEFLYFEQGQHPALGYLENPPLISWLGMISSWFGGSEAWIKFWPCLFGAGTVVITCLIAAEMGGGRFAQFLAALGVMTGAYLRVHFLFQPNILDIFFWTLAMYFLARYADSKKDSWIYGLAISLALGWWSKYSILFIGVAIIAGLLISRHRKIFLKKQSWLAMALAVLIILPNFWWQYEHNWPLIHHMQELQETQLQYLDPGDFLKDQVLMLLAVTFVWITGLVWLFRHSEYRVIGFVYFIVIVLLIAGNGKSYYSLGVYPVLLAAGAVALEKQTIRRAWARWGISFLILILSLPLIPLLLPTSPPAQLADFYKRNNIEKTGALKWEDQQNHPLPQDFADMLGWKELSTKAEEFYNSLSPSVQSRTVVYGRHYGHAGSMKFYGQKQSFRNSVITDNGSFLLWIPNDMSFDHIIFLGRRLPEKDDEVFQHFRQYRLVDSVTNPYSRQLGDKIIFFENIDSTGLRLAQQGLAEMKRQFSRE